MADAIVDPDRFQLAAALVDWTTLARRDPAFLRAMQTRGDRLRKVVQLRWVMHSKYGYPTRPFEVWRRPAIGVILEKDLPVNQPAFIYNTLFGWTAYLAPFPVTFVRATIKVNSGTATVAAFAGAPLGSTLIDIKPLTTTGFSTVSFSGPLVGSLVIWGNADLISWKGVPSGTAVQGEWTLVETVGLPVDQQQWANVFALDKDQGPPNTPMPPFDAAIDRFKRGAAPFGWASVLASGRIAPDWKQANPKAFLAMMREDVLGPLREMMTTLPPNEHAQMRNTVPLVAEGDGDPGIANYSLLNSLLVAAMTDPVASLLAGFGTAVEEQDLPPISIRDVQMLNDPTRSDYDFKVVATYDKGFDGRSDVVQLAALALAPKLAVPPPPPSNLSAVVEGLRAPPHTDQAWRPVIQLGWDRLPSFVPLRSAAYAHARADGAATVAQSLLAHRKHDDAPQPIGIATNVENPASVVQVRGSDDSFVIPGMPATTTLLYGVAHEDIFGLWSAWRTTAINVAEPPVQKVAVMSASLVPEAAGSGPCPSNLTVEFTWDWKSRSPSSVSFVGRLYPQAKRGDPPAGGAAPSGLQRSLGGASTPFKIAFDAAGNATVDAGGSLQHLSTDGKTILSGPSGAAGVRRYRLVVSGFMLDFNASRHIGLELTAQGVERRPPNRTSAPSTPATIASASDPRPPVILAEHEDVLLASVPDASGCSHALLTWPASSAVGYFVYTASEAKLRDDWAMGETPSGATLADRLVQLRDGFAAHPSRRYFTRLNNTAIGGTSYSAELPRGTRDIHLFLIVGVSAGGVESDWPSAADPDRRKRPIAYAVPLRRIPEPPTLEVRRVAKPGDSAAFAAQVTLVTRPGVVVERIDLHRVRNPEAALELDSMGEPMPITLGRPGWSFALAPSTGGAPAQPLGKAVGIDLPPGDWRPIYYRAATWSAADTTRGIRTARSKPSAAREVIVPPAGPPPLDALAKAAPGANPAIVEIVTTTSAPLDRTPLGDHRLKIEVHSEVAPNPSQLQYAWPSVTSDGSRGDTRLAAIPTTPPAGEGLWRETVGGVTRLRLRIQRASTNVALGIRVQLDDPLGRFTEQTLRIPPDPALPHLTFGPVSVTSIAHQGFVVASAINLPTTPGPAYRVRALLTPRALFPSPLPGPRPGRPRLLFDLAYADIPLVGTGDTGFATNPPGRRRPVDMQNTAILISVPMGGGRLQVMIAGPDGNSASFTREVA